MTSHALTLTPQPHSGPAAIRSLLESEERDFAWLSRKTGYSTSHLWRVVNEGRRISPDLANRLAELFGVPVTTFLQEEEE